MKTVENYAKLSFCSKSKNESFARGAVSAFIAQLDPTLDELSDVRTAVSEAVTNCVIHAYPDRVGEIYIHMKITGENCVRIIVKDRGVGIEDVNEAMEPMFTTGDPEQRSGLGFTIMETFMDSVKVRSRCGSGTTVTMVKRIEQKV